MRKKKIRICFPFVGNSIGGSHLSALELIKNIDNAKKLTTKQKDDYKTLLNKHKVDFERSGGMPVILKKHVKSSDRKFIVFCDDTRIVRVFLHSIFNCFF